MKTSLSIMDIIYILFKKLYIIVIGIIVGLMLSYSVTSFLITPKYTSSLNMYVNNGYTASGDETAVITTGTISASISLVNTYAVLLMDDTFMQSVSEELGEQISVKQLQSCVTMEAVNDTEVMNISAVTADPQLSADICNTIAALAPDMLKRVTNSGAVEVVGPATAASKPSYPNLVKNLALGGLAGAVLPALIILLLAILDTTIKSEEEIKSTYSLPSLGDVPAFKMSSEDKKNAKKHRSTATYNSIRLNDNTPFQIREAYKTIRTNIIFTLGTHKRKIVELTSASPEEYKSTTSANLAITMAQTGAKVLLIDADMRKPVQHKIFRLDNAKGLSSVLAGMDELNDAVKQNVLTNLDIFPAGPTPPNPSELLGSKNMEVLLEALEKYYDIILIDTPPVNIVTDALTLSKYTTGILLMVRQGKTRHEDIEAAIDSIYTANASVIGTILVDSDYSGRSFGYGYKYYRYYKYGGYSYGGKGEYSYSNPPETETEKR